MYFGLTNVPEQYTMFPTMFQVLLIGGVQAEERTLDNLPYLTLSYANGPSNNTQRNLTGMDTGKDVVLYSILDSTE